MRSTEKSEVTLRSEGVVVNVDPISRELTIRFAEDVRKIDVPPGCPITLRGERIRLRLVQSRDHVRVAYAEHSNSRVASSIEVRSVMPFPGSPAGGENPITQTPGFLK